MGRIILDCKHGLMMPEPCRAKGNVEVKLWQSRTAAADELDFYRHVWPVRAMTDQPQTYPTDRETLDREYSPSRLVDSLDDYLADYAGRSLAARKQLASSSKIGLKYGPYDRHRLDYFATSRADAPLVVFLHGGFWSALDESSFSFPAPAFLDAGINYASVTYRLAPEASLTEIVTDAQMAVQWLQSQAGALGFEPNQILIVGHSAGAHLAAMMLTTEARIKGALLISGVYDLEPMRRSYVNDTVRVDAKEALTNSPNAIPPVADSAVHIAVGYIETYEFKRQSALLLDAWKGDLPYCKLAEYEGRDHFNILFDLADPSSSLFGEALNLVNRNAP